MPAQDKDNDQTTTIIVFGASGDLAKKKTYPALYRLYSNDRLPKDCNIVGFARSDLSRDDFLKRVTEKIKGDKLDAFKKLLSYQSGNYDDAASFKKLDLKGDRRIFYLALPPGQFYTVSKMIKDNCYDDKKVNRLVVEKPFGKDLESSNELQRQLSPLFTEKEIFRIDHYLGKEMVKNILVLRFANVFFSALWSRQYISNVQITFKETFGSEGRGGYFDEYGIIRDVVQNHLLQVLSVFAMERPVDLNGESIRDEKVRVLKCIPPIRNEDILLGQYDKSVDGTKPSYLDDKTVPSGSKAATFAACVLYIQNERWANVPFVIKAGKALNETKSEIRVQFADVPGSIFPNLSRNELVIRVSPSEAIYMKMMNKKPGLNMETIISELDLSYSQRYGDSYIPEAYESLILDILQGDKTNFVRNDELEAAWKIFTPVLHHIDSTAQPIKYPYGSRGPAGIDEFVGRYGFVRHQQEYKWSPSQKL